MFGMKKNKSNEGVEATQETVLQESTHGTHELDVTQDNVTTTGQEDASVESTESTVRGSFIIKRTKESTTEGILKTLGFQELVITHPFLEGVITEKKINAPVLAFSSEAVETIKTHISWGKKTRNNVYEQGGILIGRPYSVNEQVIGVVECAISADATRSSGAYLEMGTDTWVKMLDTYDDLYKDRGLFVIGWYHTHPNMLSVFMSGTDMGTQKAFFNQAWHFAAVLNPHKKLIACFHSEKANPCKYCPNDFLS